MAKGKFSSDVPNITRQIESILTDPLVVNLDQLEAEYKDRIFGKGMGEQGQNIAVDNTPLTKSGALKASIGFQKEGSDSLLIRALEYAEALENQRGEIWGASDKELDIIAEALQNKLNSI